MAARAPVHCVHRHVQGRAPPVLFIIIIIIIIVPVLRRRNRDPKEEERRRHGERHADPHRIDAILFDLDTLLPLLIFHGR